MLLIDITRWRGDRKAFIIITAAVSDGDISSGTTIYRGRPAFVGFYYVDAGTRQLQKWKLLRFVMPKPSFDITGPSLML